MCFQKKFALITAFLLEYDFFGGDKYSVASKINLLKSLFLPNQALNFKFFVLTKYVDETFRDVLISNILKGKLSIVTRH